MRAPPGFFLRSPSYPFFIFTDRERVVTFPLPPFKNECPRQGGGDDVPPLSPSSFDPPPPGPIFPFVFPDTIMVLSPVQQNIVCSKMALVSVARWDKLKINRPRRRGPYRWFFFVGGGGISHHGHR
jgi:hypothetical protein